MYLRPVLWGSYMYSTLQCGVGPDKKASECCEDHTLDAWGTVGRSRMTGSMASCQERLRRVPCERGVLRVVVSPWAAACTEDPRILRGEVRASFEPATSEEDRFMFVCRRLESIESRIRSETVDQGQGWSARAVEGEGEKPLCRAPPALAPSLPGAVLSVVRKLCAELGCGGRRRRPICGPQLLQGCGDDKTNHWPCTTVGPVRRARDVLQQQLNCHHRTRHPTGQPRSTLQTIRSAYGLNPIPHRVWLSVLPFRGIRLMK